MSLTPSTSPPLRSLRERQEADALLQGYTVSDESPVFRYHGGSSILPRGYSAGFIKIMGRAGVDGYRLHDARHAHALLMLKQGVPQKSCKNDWDMPR